MTYEELLAKFNNFDTYASYDLPRNLYDALKAVVELHKPYKIGNEIVCFQCNYESGDAIDSYLLRQNYPCPTIEAIEKELK